MELQLVCASHYTRFGGEKAKRIKELIDETNPSREELSTCLYIACLGTEEPLDTIEVLLQAGADPDYISYRDRSAFQHVCWNEDLAKMDLLERFILRPGSQLKQLDLYNKGKTERTFSS